MTKLDKLRVRVHEIKNSYDNAYQTLLLSNDKWKKESLAGMCGRIIACNQILNELEFIKKGGANGK